MSRDPCHVRYKRPRWTIETSSDHAARNTPFSEREIECLRLPVLGHTDAEIAARLEIKRATVRFQLDGGRRKVGARSRAHLAAIAVVLGAASL